MRGETAEGGAIKGVRAGREDLDRLIAVHNLKVDLSAFGAPDPIALHQAHLLGPTLQPVEGGQQFLGIGRDAEEPLGEATTLDRRA